MVNIMPMPTVSPGAKAVVKSTPPQVSFTYLMFCQNEAVTGIVIHLLSSIVTVHTEAAALPAR